MELVVGLGGLGGLVWVVPVASRGFRSGVQSLGLVKERQVKAMWWGGVSTGQVLGRGGGCEVALVSCGCSCFGVGAVGLVLGSQGAAPTLLCPAGTGTGRRSTGPRVTVPSPSLQKPLQRIRVQGELSRELG